MLSVLLWSESESEWNSRKLEVRSTVWLLHWDISKTSSLSTWKLIIQIHKGHFKPSELWVIDTWNTLSHKVQSYYSPRAADWNRLEGGRELKSWNSLNFKCSVWYLTGPGCFALSCVIFYEAYCCSFIGGNLLFVPIDTFAVIDHPSVKL